MFFRRSSSPSSALIMNLPNELLSEIASYCTQWHPTSGHAVDIKSVAALSLVSQRLRANSLPYLFRDVVVTSERQLKSLAAVSPELLNIIRELNIFLDVDFYASLRTFAIRPPSPSSPYASLVNILRQAPSIAALRILVAESTGEGSAWTRTMLQRPDGIPVSNVLSPLVASKKFKLPHLKTLELDALSDIAPILQLAPNLESLRMNLPNGYAAYTNTQLTEALRSVPKLKSLSYSAESLRLDVYEDEELEEARGDNMQSVETGAAALIERIGKALPHLEVLDLQSRWYGDEILFPIAGEALSSEDVEQITHHLPNIKHLFLPTTIANDQDFAELHSTDATIRSQAIKTAADEEKQTILKLASSLSKLEKVSFVRPAKTGETFESLVRYTFKRESVKEIQLESSIRSADEGQVDALPTLLTSASGHFGAFQSFVPSRQEVEVVALALTISGVLVCGASKMLGSA